MEVGTLIYGLPLWTLGAYIVWTEWLKPERKKGGSK